MPNNNTDYREDIVAGRNAVLELLKTDKDINSILVQKDGDGTISKIVAQAAEKKIIVKTVSRIKLDNMAPGVPHQGVIAQLAFSRYSTIEDIFARAGDEAPFIVLCDKIEDPHNLGAIIRTAEAAGAHGLIIPKRRSAALSFVVAKSSAGAIEHLPVVRVSNLSSTIDQLKKRGIWFYAADMNGTIWHQQKYDGGIGLVLGAEGDGVSQAILSKCDFTVSIPMLGKVDSLNVSVASGIIMYEIVKQRCSHNIIKGEIL